METHHTTPHCSSTYGGSVAVTPAPLTACVCAWCGSFPLVTDRCLNAAQQRKFAEEHPDIRFKQVYGKILDKPPVPFNGPYGVPTEKPADEDIKMLIEVGYTSFKNDETEYPDLSGISRKGKLPPPRGTKASAGHDVRQKVAAKEKTPFKMKRFQNVQAKVCVVWLRATCAPSMASRKHGMWCDPFVD